MSNTISYDFLRGLGHKVSIGMLFAMLLLGSAPLVHADTSTSVSIQIQSLLQILDQLRAQLFQLQKGGAMVATNSCIEIKNLLTLGSTDTTSGGDVTLLQKFLTQKGYYTYGPTTGYFGQVTLDAVKDWQDTEKFYEQYGPVAGRGVVGEMSRAKIAQSCNLVTIDQKSINTSSNTFTISGTAKSTESLFVALVPPYTPNDWSAVYTTGSYVAFSGDTVTNVVNGKWSVKFAGVKSGVYEVRVYSNNNSARQSLLSAQPLTVNAPDVINFSVGSSPKTITLGVNQKATDGGITITATDVFLTNGLSGSPRASFIIEPVGFNTSASSAGLDEFVGHFADPKAPNKTIQIKVTSMSQAMNTVTITIEDSGKKG